MHGVYMRLWVRILSWLGVGAVASGASGVRIGV